MEAVGDSVEVEVAVDGVNGVDGLYIAAFERERERELGELARHEYRGDGGINVCVEEAQEVVERVGLGVSKEEDEENVEEVGEEVGEDEVGHKDSEERS
jgi:hypothetical protein